MCGAHDNGMTNQLQTIDVVTLTEITGGQQQPKPQPKPQAADETKWVRNAAKCARVGGPILGALCGVLTPTPAN